MKILYFAWLKQKTGQSSEEVTPPAEVGTVAELADWLAARSPGHAEALADRRVVRVAIDQEFADYDTPITGAREIAFFPPVTGG